MRRSGILALLVVSALVGASFAGAPAARADTPPVYHFYGAGYGHGVGMGAWGVYGMALKHWSTTGILHHFYPGTSIAKATDPAFIRVGLVQGALSIPVNAWHGPAQLRLGNPNTGTLVATIPGGSTWTVIDKSGHYWIRRGDGTFVGGHGWGSATNNLYVRFAAMGSILYLPQRGYHFNHGFMELNIYKPCDTCTTKERIILQLATENYVEGVGEVPATWPATALHVFAIAARTYVTYKVHAVGQHRAGCNCGIWYVGEQFFIGYNRNLQTGAANWMKAVHDTSHVMALYGGSPIVAAYSTSTGGHSQSNVEEWGGTQIPYLKSVCDPGDYVDPNQYKTWSVTISKATVTDRLTTHFGQHVGAIVSFNVLARSESMRITSIRINGNHGSYTVSGNAFANALGLRTALVYVNVNRLITGVVRKKYDSLMCAPRLPTSTISHPAGGAVQHFTLGTIYADVVHARSRWLFGLVDTKYRAMHGPTGRLGWPMTGVDVHGAIRSAHFMHGTITCNADTDTCSVTPP